MCPACAGSDRTPALLQLLRFLGGGGGGGVCLVVVVGGRVVELARPGLDKLRPPPPRVCCRRTPSRGARGAHPWVCACWFCHACGTRGPSLFTRAPTRSQRHFTRASSTWMPRCSSRSQSSPPGKTTAGRRASPASSPRQTSFWRTAVCGRVLAGTERVLYEAPLPSFFWGRAAEKRSGGGPPFWSWRWSSLSVVLAPVCCCLDGD